MGAQDLLGWVFTTQGRKNESGARGGYEGVEAKEKTVETKRVFGPKPRPGPDGPNA